MRRLLLLPLLFLAVALGSDLLARGGTQVTRWPDGRVRSQVEALRMPDGRVVYDGRYVAFHPNGVKAQEGLYARGEKVGTWRRWRADGSLSGVTEWKGGEGAFTGYFPDGGKHLEGRYRGEAPEGVWREWDEEGRLRKEGAYRRGLQEGPWRFWNPGAEPDSETVVFHRGQPEGRAAPAPLLPWAAHLRGVAGWMLLLLAPLPWGLWLAGRSRGSRGSDLEDGIVVLVGCLAAAVTVPLLLGAVGALRPPEFWAGQGLLLVGGMVLWSRSGRWRPARPRLTATESVLAGAALLLGLLALVRTLAVPMTDWDGLAYHLPLAAEWLQAGRFAHVPWLGQTALYPAHGEVLALGGWFCFGEDLLFTAPALLAWILCGLGVTALGRRAGASGAVAGAAALLVLSTPLVLLQLEELKPDLLLAGLFVAALVLAGTLDARGRRPLPLLLALGLLLGTKSSGPAYAVVAVGAGALAGGAWWDRGSVAPGVGRTGGAPSRRGPGAAVLVVLAAILLGGFWYLRNWIQVGNPLGLVQVGVGGWTLFEGSIPREALWRTTFAAVFRPLEGADWRVVGGVLVEQMSGPGLLLTALAVAAVVGAAVRRARVRTTLVLLGVTLACGLLFAMTPFSGDNGSHGWRLSPWVGQALRYGLPRILATAVLGALGAALWRVPERILVGVAVAGALWAGAVQAAPPRQDLAWTLLLGTFVLLPLAWSRATSSAGGSSASAARPAAVLLAAALAVALAFGLHDLRAQREDLRRELYDFPYRYLRTQPRDTVTAVAMTQLRYPFYGRSLMRPVVDGSSYDGDRPAWLERLRARGVDLLAVGPRPVRRYLFADEVDLSPWIQDGPFQPVPGQGGGVEGVRLYRLED